MESEYLSLAQIVKDLPGRPTSNTVWRWCRDGIKGRDGQRVRLEHVRVGARLFVTRAAADAFFKAIQVADINHFSKRDEPGARSAQIVPSRTPAQRSKDADAAHQRLAAAGM